MPKAHDRRDNEGLARKSLRRATPVLTPRVTFAAAAILAAALALAAAFAGRPDACPNIVLITVDTLRADRLGLYGDPTARTPRIDALGHEGLVFDNAACPMPMTRPSHASILSSLYPRDHGVVNNRIDLPHDVATLPEILQAHGYATGAFVSAKLLGPDSGFARGFDAFAAPRSTPMWDADATVPRALDWIGARAFGTQPFFVWLHLFDPHIPYAPPPAYRPGGPLARELGEASWPSLVALAERHGGTLSSEALDRAERLYAGEIAFTDRWIGILTDRLEDLGLLEDTVIVLTSDHGECFENGVFFEHSECLYDGAVRVPLLLRYPKQIAPGRRGEQVENLAIAPTLCELAGVAVPREFSGISLLRPANEKDAAAHLQHPLYQQDTTENRQSMLARIRSVAGVPVKPLLSGTDEVGLRTVGWKYLAGGDSLELYDLAADPREQRNLASEHPATARELDARLKRWVREHPLKIVDDSKINEELRETLRSLGYVQ